MNASDFTRIKVGLFSQASSIADAKRPAYTGGNEDVLHNFKETARRCGITPLQAWAVHYEKHASAIMSFCKNPSGLQAEPIAGRFADALNYLSLGLALIADNEPQKLAHA